MRSQIAAHSSPFELNKGRGRTLKELAREPLWKVVQATPSAARFPEGESIFEMQARAVLAVERLREAHQGQTVAVCSHADVIKALIAAGADPNRKAHINAIAATLGAVAKNVPSASNTPSSMRRGLALPPPCTPSPMLKHAVKYSGSRPKLLQL